MTAREIIANYCQQQRYQARADERIQRSVSRQRLAEQQRRDRVESICESEEEQ